MAITNTTATRNSMATHQTSLVDVGTTDASGDLGIYDSGDTLLVTFALSATAFGAPSSGVCTLAGLPLSNTAAASGTASYYRYDNRDNTEQWRGTVTATGGGGDLELQTVTIVSGQTVNVTSATYTHPA